MTGVTVGYAENITVSNNYINNTDAIFDGVVSDGIALTYNTNNSFVFTNWIDNSQTGINVSAECFVIVIYDNHISNSDYNNAVDDNTDANVVWHLAGAGNWWDDWTIPDGDNNGVVDIPRGILGTGANEDVYPRTTAGTDYTGAGGSGGGGGAPSVPDLEIEPDDSDLETGVDWGFSIGDLSPVFWIGGIILLIGLIKVPIPGVPFLKPFMLLAIGGMLMVLSFVW